MFATNGKILQVALQRDEEVSENGRYDIKAENGGAAQKIFSGEGVFGYCNVMRSNNASNGRKRQRKINGAHTIFSTACFTSRSVGFGSPICDTVCSHKQRIVFV